MNRWGPGKASGKGNMTFPYMTKNVIALMTKNVVHCMTKKIVPRITKNLVLCMTKNAVPCVTSNVVPCMTKNNASGVFKNQSSVTHGSCRIILGFQQSNKASKFRKQIMQLLQSSWQNGRCTMHFFFNCLLLQTTLISISRLS